MVDKTRRTYRRYQYRVMNTAGHEASLFKYWDQFHKDPERLTRLIEIGLVRWQRLLDTSVRSLALRTAESWLKDSLEIKDGCAVRVMDNDDDSLIMEDSTWDMMARQKSKPSNKAPEQPRPPTTPTILRPLRPPTILQPSTSIAEIKERLAAHKAKPKVRVQMGKCVI